MKHHKIDLSNVVLVTLNKCYFVFEFWLYFLIKFTFPHDVGYQFLDTVTCNAKGLGM